MRRSLTALLAVGLLAGLTSGVEAQTPGEVFRKVAPSVVVIRARGQEIAASGQTRFGETGSACYLVRRQGDDRRPRRPRDGRDSVEFLVETVKARDRLRARR